MKALMLWSMLILIASALLLSGASSASETPQPNPKTSEIAEQPTPEVSQQPNASQTVQSSAAPSMTASPQADAPNLGNGQNQGDASVQREARYTGFLVIVGLAAIAIAIFNYCAAKSAADAASSSAETAAAQLEFTKTANQQNIKIASDALEAAKQNTKAARVAAEAAQRSLDIHRPFLLVTGIAESKITHDGSTPTIRHNFSFSMAIKNFGASPADIIDYIAEAEVFDAPRLPKRGDPQVWYGPDEGQQINDSIVSPNETVADRIYATITVNDAEYGTLRDEEKRIGIHGRIRYRGASPTVFNTFFFWWCFGYDSGDITAIGQFESLQFARAMTKKLNDHT